MLNVSVHTGLPRAVLQSRVPAPQGLCAGEGTLPPARVSSQPACGDPHGAAGKTCGWKDWPPPEQGPSSVHRVPCASGLLTTPDHPRTFLRGHFRRKGRGGITIKIRRFPESEFSLLWSWGISEEQQKRISHA